MYKKLIKIFYVFLFLFSIISFPVNATNKNEEETCYEQFNRIDISEIQKIFSDPENYIKYEEQEGYLLFAERSPNINSMSYLFNLVSDALEANFKKLKWRQYHGSITKFKEERGQILNEKGEVKKQYVEMDGCARYAEQYHKGNMQKAFTNVSVVLGGYWGIQKLNLRWSQFQGSSSEYYKLIQFFKDHQAMDFKGPDGQREVAKRIFKGHNRRTYNNVSILREILFDNWDVFKELNWSKNLM